MPKLTENDAVVVMMIRDYEELEAMKAKYLKLCFESAQNDLAQDDVVDGERFLKAL